MNLQPFLNASLFVQVHAIAALVAMFLGAYQLLKQKGTRSHRLLGYVWVVCMATAAITSFRITGIRLFGPYSPIHALSVLACVALVQMIWHIRTGNVAAHAATAKSLYLYGLGIAGFFTLIPGRLAHRVLFGEDSLLGFALLAAAAGAIIGYRHWQSRRKPALRLPPPAAES